MKNRKQLWLGISLIFLVVSFSKSVLAEETSSSSELLKQEVVVTTETVTKGSANEESDKAVENSDDKIIKSETVEQKEAADAKVKAETKVRAETKVKPDTKEINLIELEKQKNFLKKYLENNYVNQEQYEATLSKLINATTDEEIQKIMNELEGQLDPIALLTKGAFADSYINIKSNINGMIANGSLTKEQGQDFLNQLEKSTTKEELTSLWERIAPYMKKEQEKTETSTSESKSQVTPVDKKTEEKQKNEAQKLPQTGENNRTGLIFIGALLLVLGVVGVIIKFKTKKLPIRIK